MSENVKLRFDLPNGQSQQAAVPNNPLPGDDATQEDEAESAMRKALGLLGDTPRHRQDTDRADPAPRGPDRFNGGLHRRRFVQDGDVPVTVLRREPGHEAPAHRTVAATPAAPSSSRLQRTEAALAAETAGREKAERGLLEVQTALRDLQTKIGHAELAKNEAIDALRQERDAMAGLRAQIEALTSQVQEAEARVGSVELAAAHHESALAEERNARKVLEKSLQSAEAARDAAEQRMQTLSVEAKETVEVAPRRKPTFGAEVHKQLPEAPEPARKRGRPPGVKTVAPPEAEQEPVKWWLSPSKPAAKRR